MKKRIVSLLLVLSLLLSLLPSTAFAAVGGLLGNDPAENESILAQLEDFTGESYEEAYALLESLGLLNEDGSLITDRTIDLGGTEYTLEEMEALLSDPDTDLTEVATVDGVPIALGDLKTIIAIERQLQYLQEKYFTGRTFEGEALDNLNSLMAQLQSEGMTLAADSTSQIVFDTSTVQQAPDSISPIYYISSVGDVTIPAGTSLTVKFKLNLSDAMKNTTIATSPMIYLSDKPTVSTPTSSALLNDGRNSSVVYIVNGETQFSEYSLTLGTYAYDYTGPLYLCLRGPSLQSTAALNYDQDFAEYSYGTLWQAVSFYDANGFFFQNGTGGALSDQWTGYFSAEHDLPEMPDSVDSSDAVTIVDEINPQTTVNHLMFSLAYSTTLDRLEKTLTYLQRCIDDLDADNAIRTHVTATIKQENTDDSNYLDGEKHRNLIVPREVLLGVNTYIVDNNSISGFPLNLPSGSGTADISYDVITTALANYSSVYSLNFTLTLMVCKNENVTWDQVKDGDFDETYTYYIDGSTTTTTKASFSLVNDGKAPNLTVTAPTGTYQSGDVIPITITGDEFIKATDDTKITINNTEYTLAQLHGSTSGKYLTLFYEVKEIDDARLTVGIAANSGITDYWGNQNAEVNNVTVSGVTITTPLLKNAVSGLTASYDADTQQLSTTISVKQEGYQNLYNTYQNNKDGAMQLLISVDGGEAQPHTVTMGGSGNTFTFTAAPYTIERKAAEQAVTVQLQVSDGSGGWTTVKWLSASATVPELVKVQSVNISVVDQPADYDYQLTLDSSATVQLQAAIAPGNATDQTGSWHSSNEDIASINASGQITPKKVGSVKFYYEANNGGEPVKSNELTFTVTAGDQLTLVFPDYAQDALVRADSAATVTWITNAMEFYPDTEITFTVKLYEGDGTGGEAAYKQEVKNTNELTIPAEYLTADYPQSGYTVEVSMSDPEPRSDTASIIVLSPPTQVTIGADKTSLTDGETLALNCTISNQGAAGTLSATRMTETGTTAENVDSCLSGTSVSDGEGTVTFTPLPVAEGSLYDTYTITFTETLSGSADPSFAPSTDSMVLTVYRSGALEITGDDVIELDNTSKVDSSNGNLPTDSAGIMALRQELGLIEYVSINADAYDWSSFSDGIKWVSDHPEAVSINYRQGGLWDNIEDLPYETYLPNSQMAVSATADGTATITATHAATGMSDTVTVNAKTLREQFYLFQVTPAERTQVTYTNGNGDTVTTYTNADGLLALYEPSGIKSDVVFSSGDDKNPNLGTILEENLASGEKDAAKLQLYPLNTITLQPAAEAEVYLVKPDGSPYVGSVTLRGGVYLAGYYCDGAKLGNAPDSLQSGGEDATYTTDADGKLTVYMDATQFLSPEYEGQLTNAALDYWFELSDINNDTYFPTLVNIQGSMSADYKLRTGSAVVTLREVPQGEEEEPFLIAQTLSYAKESPDEGLQVRSVMGSTGRVGPNSTYKYSELTTRIMLWGVDNDLGESTVTMTGENGFAPEAQSVDVNTFPFASIPIITNTLVLTKETMTESGWLAAETPAGLKASVYQNNALVKTVTMPFQVIDLTDVKLVDEDAEALVVEMKGSLTDGFGTTDGNFNFGSNIVGSAFSGKITGLLNDIQENVNPLFRVLITPSEDSSVFNVLIWGGYNSLDIDDFDYSDTGFAMDYGLVEAELDVGVPPLNDLSDMAKGTYDPVGSVNEVKYNRTNSGLDIGAQLEGYYEGQFYYDTDQHKWAFRTLGGGMTAGASASFQANINAWAGPVPITATFAAGIALQLDFKAATVYKDQADDTSSWTTEALKADSVNDYLTTLRIQGYIDAFGGLGFDYSVLALKIGLYGRLTADSTNKFLSRTYLQSDKQVNGSAFGLSGEVGIKFFAKFLFISYETVIASGSFTYTPVLTDGYKYIEEYWSGSASGASLMSMGAPTLLSRAYLTAYADGAAQRWATGAAAFDSTAAVAQKDANPGSEPAVNDDGSLSVYISDMGDPDNYFASRIRAGAVGAEGTVINEGGFGDMSPSISGDSSFTVAAWVRLFEDLEKSADQVVSPAEEKLLLNSTEIMAAVYTGGSWTTTQLTENVSPDLAPATAASDDSAIVFWRGVYTTDEDFFADEQTKPSFDTQDAIYFKQYSGSGWGESTMVYNGSQGSVVGMKAAMLSSGASILVFTIDRGSSDPEKPMAGYELAYRTVAADGTLGDLVVLTSDSETDTNPQVMAVDGSSGSLFLLGWYSTQDGGDIRLQTVGADGQLYRGASANAVPASVKAITREDDLGISADFQFARQYQAGSIEGITLVWPEMAYEETAEGSLEADHSVLYGTRLCEIDGAMYLSSPQALITLPDRTLANSFSAWQDGSGKVSAYIFGTWYDPVNTEDMTGADGNTYEVPVDADQLLTGGGSLQAGAVAVDYIRVDYPNLRADSWTPVIFALCNTGTTQLTNLTVTVGSYSSAPVTLNPGESASVTVSYKTGDPITNPNYTVSADNASGLESGVLHLDYNDIGIGSMEVVEESEGQRTVQVTLYNSSDAKLKGSGRTVELSFYTDSAHTQPAAVTLVGGQSGVSAAGNTITLSGGALGRMDQGSMTFQAKYDLADYVTDTLEQEEVPESGVYLYAASVVKDGAAKTMAEYAKGNNDSAVQFTGALARTGKATEMDVSISNTDEATKATVTLKNNSLQSQPDKGVLVAVLLDEEGVTLESKVAMTATALSCEETQRVEVQFDTLGADVVLLYDNGTSSTGTEGLQELIFSGIAVGLDDFEKALDEEGQPIENEYVYTLEGEAPESTMVSFISSADVIINEENHGKAGGVSIDIPTGDSAITIESGGKTYTLNLYRTYISVGGSYKVTVMPSEHGTVTASSVLARKGLTVRLTVKPEAGYTLNRLTATDGTGKPLTLTDKGDGTHTFTMPGSAVTVTAEFRADSGGLPFTDVPSTAWYYDAVCYVYDKGMMNGVSSTLFAPNSELTRGMIVTILHRLEGTPAVADGAGFADVAPGLWYSDAVAWAASEEIVKGYGNGSFGPEDSITREQLATILYRYAQYKGYDVSVGEDTNILSYTDAFDVSEYAIPAMQWACGAGIINGTGDGSTLSPLGRATRAEVAAMLMRFCETAAK